MAKSSQPINAVCSIDAKKKRLHDRLGEAAQSQGGVEALINTPRPGFGVEVERKNEVLAFLDQHYTNWRQRAVADAQPFMKMTEDDAKKPFALVHVQTLGRAWWATNDPAYGQAFEQLYLTTDTGDLFNWAHFAGAQGLRELPAHLMLMDCPGYSSQGRIAFLDHLFALCDIAWDRYASRWNQLTLGTQGHNWHLYGIETLPYVGTLFPELKRAEFYRRTSWSVIEEHLRGNYHRDGGSRETCPGYHRGSMLKLWQLYGFAKRHDIALGADFQKLLLRATHFLINILSPEGCLPSFGDMGSPSMVDMTAIATANSGDPLCKWATEFARHQSEVDTPAAAGQIPEIAFWQVGLAGAQAYAKVQSQAPQKRSICLPDTGLAVLRDSWQQGASSMAISAAARGPIVTSHGHNDIFTFELSAMGTRFMGQPGFAPYGESDGRGYDIATRGHNCVTIQGREQLPIVNEWRWDGCVLPRIRRWDLDQDIEIFYAAHEGFCRANQSTIHERKIIFIKSKADAADQLTPGYWVVFDRLESHTTQTYEAWFHGCVEAESDGHNVIYTAADMNRLALVPPCDDKLQLRLDNDPAYEDYAKSAGFDLATHPVHVYDAAHDSHCFIWVLMPLASDEELPKVKRLPVRLNDIEMPSHIASAVRVTHRGLVDTLCLNHQYYDAQLVCDGGIDAWGQTVFQRATADGEVHSKVVRRTKDGVNPECCE